MSSMYARAHVWVFLYTVNERYLSLRRISLGNVLSVKVCSAHHKHPFTYIISILIIILLHFQIDEWKKTDAVSIQFQNYNHNKYEYFFSSGRREL